MLNAARNAGTSERTRIAVLNSHPIQYFAPLYAYLYAAPDLDLTALYLSDFSVRGGWDVGFGQDVKWDVDLLAGYRSVFLGDAARTREPGGSGRSLPRSLERGLAVSEAMCASLPVAVSREVGCVTDLVRDGVNGYTPASGDVAGLAYALQRLIEDEGLRRRQGRERLARILQWGYQQCLEGLRAALAGLEFRGSGRNFEL